MKTKVKIYGHASLEVHGVEPKEVFREIDFHLGTTKSWDINRVRRGAPKKVKVISEGAAG